MKEIILKNIKKNFFTLRRGKVEALKGINLEIKAGSFFVLLGPSGCGKSTLLNIIAGIEKQTSGEIYFEDKLVASPEKKLFLSPKQRDIAMVFQSYALYPHMTVYDNMAFPLKISKRDKKEIKEKVENAADILQITKLLDAKPGELSGGQRQRVALGRAIVRKPNLLLLDEPLSNLDALLRISMRSELKQIQRELKLTTIYVTHDQIEAMSLGDKIAILKEGEVQQLGTPDEIYNQPANLFVAKFIGSPPMNIFNEIISEKIIQRYFDTTDKNLIAGSRPEHIKIVNKNEGLFNAKIKMIGSLGSESIVYLSVENGEILSKITEPISQKEGEEIGINIEKKNVYLFNKDSGELINKQSPLR